MSTGSAHANSYSRALLTLPRRGRRHYAQRAVEPPAVAALRDLATATPNSVSIYSTFPIAQIEQGLGVRILEPGYSREHAPAFLLGGGVDERGGLSRALDLGGTEARRAREAKAVQLLEQPLTIGKSRLSRFLTLPAADSCPDPAAPRRPAPDADVRGARAPPAHASVQRRPGGRAAQL